ncbi:hypothetical protein [Phenylobacterium sp.]|uniref:hypothetical protein n=1 Tax=Phenylobacterium sp. TaxID=1871053 RepID=UPI002C22DC3C|nr:hypothetical protein [Phenylobacterium sp.]HLZ76466.1 hypothetical protein [Phenylobacterium sp.]
MRKALSLAAAAALAATATLAHAGAQLDGPPLRAPAKLDCPAASADLTRTAQSPDGQWCDYAGQHGETVRLRLAPLNGQTPSEALAPERAQLHGLVPVYHQPMPISYSGGDSADVNVPFVHVHKDGDKADVRLFGIFHIVGHDHDSDFDHDRAQEHTSVHAGLRGAEVVADKVGRNNASLVYVLAGSHRYSSGYRAVGYVAKGPTAGPLVVAEFRSPVNSHRDNDTGHLDLDRLIDLQLGR